jgi:hypothetical protein
MAKTVVASFKDAEAAEKAAREIQSNGFPRNEVRTLGEPLDFGQTGVMSIPNIDFEVEVFRELTRIGATKEEAEGYIDGLRRGEVLLFATGSDEEQVGAAAAIMNRYGAKDAEQTRGPEPELPVEERARAAAATNASFQTGRIRQTGSGARYFVW